MTITYTHRFGHKTRKKDRKYELGIFLAGRMITISTFLPCISWYFPQMLAIINLFVFGVWEMPNKGY